MEEAGSDALWWWRKKPQALELRPPLEAGKDEEVDVPLEPPGRTQPFWHLNSSPVKPIWGFWTEFSGWSVMFYTLELDIEIVAQLLNHVQLFVTPWTPACQASLSIINSWSLLKLVSIESVMPSNHLILCYPLLLPSIFPRIRVFSLVTHKLWLYSHGHCNDLSLLIFQVSVFSSVKLK